jgi:hypothetical protein
MRLHPDVFRETMLWSQVAVTTALAELGAGTAANTRAQKLGEFLRLFPSIRAATP